MADKRKDRVAEIKARMESSAYNLGQYKKNFKNLDEKVAFFVNKEAAGELKPFMRPRFEEAEKTLARLKELHGEGYAKSLPATAVKATAAKPTAPKATAPKATAPKATVAKPTAAKATTAKATGAKAVANTLSKMTLSSPSNRPVLGNNGKPLTIRSRRLRTVRSANSNKPKTLRKPRNVGINEFMETAFLETQKKVPELYNPFTGVKYEREESPMPDIEKAYMILRKIRTNTISRARVLRTRASKGKNNSKTQKKNSPVKLSVVPEENESLVASAAEGKSANSNSSSNNSNSSSNSNSPRTTSPSGLKNI